MDQQVIVNGTYEPEVTDLLVELLEEDGVFWDVGANVGVHSLSVQSRRPKSTVVGFEPAAAQFVRLVRNAKLNQLPVIAYCVALAEQRGYRDLSVVDAGNSGLNSLVPWEHIAYERKSPVWCDTAEHLVAAGVPAPSVVKIDVEGGEFAVLAGFGRVLAAVKHVVFESTEVGEGHRLLWAAGFEITPLPSTGGGRDWLATRT